MSSLLIFLHKYCFFSIDFFCLILTLMPLFLRKELDRDQFANWIYLLSKSKATNIFSVFFFFFFFFYNLHSLTIFLFLKLFFFLFYLKNGDIWDLFRKFRFVTIYLKCVSFLKNETKEKTSHNVYLEKNNGSIGVILYLGFLFFSTNLYLLFICVFFYRLIFYFNFTSNNSIHILYFLFLFLANNLQKLYTLYFINLPLQSQCKKFFFKWTNFSISQYFCPFEDKFIFSIILYYLIFLIWNGHDNFSIRYLTLSLFFYINYSIKDNFDNVLSSKNFFSVFFLLLIVAISCGF